MECHHLFLMIAAADVLLRRHEQHLSSNKECLTPAVEVCQGGKAHGFQEVTVSGTIICLVFTCRYLLNCWFCNKISIKTILHYGESISWITANLKNNIAMLQQMQIYRKEKLSKIQKGLANKACTSEIFVWSGFVVWINRGNF